MANPPGKAQGGWGAVLLVPAAAICFHIAYFTQWGVFIIGYAVCLVLVARVLCGRMAFYAGLAAGLLCFAPQLWFFWSLFHLVAVVLWMILAFWIALFTGLSSAAFRRLHIMAAVWLIPFLWTGLEYFRSECYYLRFSWLNIGYAFANSPAQVPVFPPGVYGWGFLVVLLAVCIVARCWKWLIAAFVVAVIIGAFLPVYSGLRMRPVKLAVAGVQMEFPTTGEVIANLDKLLAQHPETQVFVLSEYTFSEPVPAPVADWCRAHGKYLVVGAIDPAPDGNYYDTAFVIGPGGDVVFKQAKSVPIQFFKDGLPAREQGLWESPWGKIGICICYDLSYTRVTDPLVRMGAQALIVPTMDVEEWGRHEHALHERVAIARAGEYSIPVFRVASSGISQLVDGLGIESATAPFAGEGATITGDIAIRGQGTLPLDRYLAPLCVAITAIFIACLIVGRFFRLAMRMGKPSPSMEI